MARSVTFNGVTRFRPGGITRVNADALNQVGTSASGTVGIIGESDGGEPGSSAGLVSLRDPAQAEELFRPGAMADAIKLAFQPSGDPLVPGGAAEVLVYKANASTQSTVHLPSESLSVVSTTAGGGATVTNVPVAATLVASAHVGRWADITLAAMAGSPTYRRKITANTTSALTVSPALPQAPASGNVVEIRASFAKITSRDYGAHTSSVAVDLDYDSTATTYQVTVSFEGEEQVSPSLGGKNFLQLEYHGGGNAVAQDTILTPGTVTATFFDLTAGGLGVGAQANKTVRIQSGSLIEYHKISTNAAGNITLLSPGMSDELVAAIQAASASTATVQILTVTNAVGTMVGSLGRATSFTTTITGISGDDLAITFSTAQTVQNLVDQINANVNYVARVPAGINPAALVVDFDFGTSTAINIQKDMDRNGGLGFKQDVMAVVNWFNDNAAYATAERWNASGQDGHGMPGTAANDNNPKDGDYPYRLAGGVRGVSTNSNWQSGFDAMLLDVADEVVALIDDDLSLEGNSSTATWAAVSQQLVDHVVAARGASGRERGGWIGFVGTKAEYIAACNSLNDMDVHCVSQNPRVVGATGELEVKSPRFLAVMGAGMRCGVTEIGEPLTHKLLRCAGITQDASWGPADTTDIADLILAGAMVAESVPGIGIRWVRDLTTWVKDDNLAYSEGSVRDVVRFVAYELRTALENRFTGRKATPATIASVKDAAAALLETFRSRDIIVDSTDPATGAVVRAYHNLKVTSSGDVVTLRVGVFPVPGINFQLNDIYLQLPTQSA